jgi:hypothetical protein
MLTKQRPRLFSAAVYTEVQAILKVKKKDRMAKPMSDKPKAKLINTNRNKWRLCPNQKKEIQVEGIFIKPLFKKGIKGKPKALKPSPNA